MNTTNIYATLLLTALLMLSGCQTITMASTPNETGDINALAQGLTLVAQNHATMQVGANTFILDTYIQPFAPPYYVLVYKQNANRLNKTVAEFIAIQYIQSQGCTQPASRRPQLDKQNSSKTAYLIGITC